jgi:Asp-tRNA(Asn)/Glu-tRNA(Gln) amidotransferase A subunit family amidase
MGSSTTSSSFGKTKFIFNDKEFISGGSSGGSAISVKSNTCLASIGIHSNFTKLKELTLVEV